MATPVVDKTQVILPPGMTQEEFNKLFGSFMKSRVATAARDKAWRAAVKDLTDKYPDEFKALMKKHGYEPKS